MPMSLPSRFPRGNTLSIYGIRYRVLFVRILHTGKMRGESSEISTNVNYFERNTLTVLFALFGRDDLYAAVKLLDKIIELKQY